MVVALAATIVAMALYILSYTSIYFSHMFRTFDDEILTKRYLK